LQKILSSLADFPETSKISNADKDFTESVVKHSSSLLLRYLARVLTVAGIVIFGRQRGPRFARRLCFEISWRVFGQKTYQSSGIVGRMFYEQ
jgi:spore maturation protein CgeB